MGDKTGIQWTDATWNPVRGCSRTIARGASQSGCGDGTGGGCYAEAMAGRFCGPGQPYEGLVRATPKGPRWTGVVRMVPEHLADPLRWRRPRRVFVNSMSDLFHEALTNEQIAAVFGVMAAAPQHTFQVLTKRAERMRDWFRWASAQRGRDARVLCSQIASELVDGVRWDFALGERSWPLPNVWLGVSVENQAAADERIPLLLETPAAVRFLSCEPLLGPVDIKFGLGQYIDKHGNWRQGEGVGWVIAGCESGTGARPAKVAWYRTLRDQCAAAGVPFFLKQAAEGYDDTLGDGVVEGMLSSRKAGGVIGLPYLDGVQHAAFPGPR
jgi:protein gp37